MCHTYMQLTLIQPNIMTHFLFSLQLIFAIDWET